MEKIDLPIENQEEELSPEEKENMARSAREGLTHEFLDRIKFLQDMINTSTKKAVVDGNFSELNKIINSLKSDADRLQENYEKYWKDLGPDKK